MSISHDEGKAIATRAIPHATPKESLVLRALSVLESGGYGNGWRAFTPSQIARWGSKLQRDGRGSNNWGAITAGRWPGATFDHPDHYINKKGARVDYVAKFRVYPTPEDGAIDLYRLALQPNVKVATSLGDILGISRAMKDNNYYGGNEIQDPAREKLIHEHAGKLRSQIASIIGKTGEPDPFVVDPVVPPNPEHITSPKFLVAALVLGLVVYIFVGATTKPRRKAVAA